MQDKKNFFHNIYKLWWLPAVIGLIIFISSLGNDFTNWDDYQQIVNNKSIQELSIDNVISFFKPSFSSTYQPLRKLSYALDYTIGGNSPFIYHLHNLILYLLNILLIYFIVKELLGERVAFWSALIFAVHPIHVEAVVWASARKDVLSGLFFFLSLYLFIKFDKNKNLTFYIGSLLTFVLALLSKPSTVVLPLLLLLYDLTFSKTLTKNRSKIKGKLICHLPYWLPNLLIIFYFIFFATTRKGYREGSFLLTMGTEGFVILRYIFKIFIPINLLPRYIIYPFKSMNLQLILGALLNIALLTLAIVKFKSNKIISFIILWFYIALIPVANIIPISILMADRYIYIPSFAFALLLAYLVEKYGRERRWLYIILIIYLIFFSVQTVRYTSAWKNSVTLWDDAIAKNPDHHLAYNQLGFYYTQQGQLEKAYSYYKKAVECYPDYLMALKNLTFVAMDLKKYDEGLHYASEALQIEPDSEKLNFYLGTIYFNLQEDKKAIETLERVIEQNPGHVNALVNLATIYYKRGDYERALKYSIKSHELDSTHPQGLKNLAASYYELGEFDKALQYFATYLECYPEASDKDTISGFINALKGQVEDNHGRSDRN